jgi:hypothetical protein
MMDANANRAREGLRVMEDIARFVLDRGDLSAAAKQIRHDLADAIAQTASNPLARLASRDVEGDVGTSISTPSEARRGGWRDLALAAAGRATEALRVLEESAKMMGRLDAAVTLEQCRYRCRAATRNSGGCASCSPSRSAHTTIGKPSHRWQSPAGPIASNCGRNRFPTQNYSIAPDSWSRCAGTRRRASH